MTYLILSILTSYTPLYNVGECARDTDNYPSPLRMYRKIVNKSNGEYTYQFMENEKDRNTHLFNHMPYQLFDENNIRVECPEFLK